MAALTGRHFYYRMKRAMKWNYAACAAAAAKFNTRKDFKAQENGQYQWLIRNGLLDQACAHMVPLHRSFSDDDIAEIAKRYASRRAFKLGDQAAYQAARKRDLLDTVCAHMATDRYRVMSDEQIFEIAQRYSSRMEFRAADKAAYQTATKRGIIDAVCSQMDGRPTRRLSDNEILEIAKQFNARNDFKLGDFGAYTTAIRRGLIVEACEHMEYGAWGFREDKPAVLYHFRMETAEGLVLYKIGITNRKPKQRLLTMGLQPGAKAELLDQIKFESGRDARIAEKRLHRRMSRYRYSGPPVLKNGNTELFTVRMLDA